MGMQITAGPYLQNVARDAITIMWHTDEPATSLVEYEKTAQTWLERLRRQAGTNVPMPDRKR